MAVLINDMEVEVQTPEPATPSGPSNSQSTTPGSNAMLSPTDINTILCQQIERLERVRAH